MSALSALFLITLGLTARSCVGQLNYGYNAQYNDDSYLQPSMRYGAYNANYKQPNYRAANDYTLDSYNRGRSGAGSYANDRYNAPRYGYDRDSNYNYRDRYDDYSDRYSSRYKNRNRYDYDYTIKPTTCSATTVTASPSCVTSSTKVTVSYVGAVCFQTTTTTSSGNTQASTVSSIAGTRGSCSPVEYLPYTSKQSSDTPGTVPCYTTTLASTIYKKVTCTFSVQMTSFSNVDTAGAIATDKTRDPVFATDSTCYYKGERLRTLGTGTGDDD
ncbi:uncharacterized protein LOC129582267 [Paramacrobiotus metropolitanus]|uniref:uncharacterized protein LOC129582267 n=1 Tax=Paramacrobiotus metropolitanus TaxID=2943436 RepID=UPI0024460D51|nr:uncharacterized protein LOC129582267 [Paramacrobiotus metropolitanus]